ncbi:response regulator [Leucobacter luti]|uniref:response regulator n=1 Tax=Leucobacter luti TaxID=340320 RepID=UPI003D067E1E
MIRVLIVDAERYARSGLRVLLEGHGDLAVVGEASSAPEAFAAARAKAPDVVLMDVTLPDRSAFGATRAFAGAVRPVPVVLVTAAESDDFIFGAIDAGASGVLPKSAGPGEIVAAIRAAVAGRAIISPEIAPRVLAEFARRRPATPRVPSHTLTGREVEVIRALVSGDGSNADVAGRLGLTPGSVKGHIGRILPKLGLRTRTELGVWAVRGGIAE